MVSAGREVAVADLAAVVARPPQPLQMPQLPLVEQRRQSGRAVKERITFTTWKHWHKDSPLPDSGLLGPVRLRIGERVEMK